VQGVGGGVASARTRPALKNVKMEKRCILSYRVKSTQFGQLEVVAIAVIGLFLSSGEI